MAAVAAAGERMGCITTWTTPKLEELLQRPLRKGENFDAALTEGLCSATVGMRRSIL